MQKTFGWLVPEGDIVQGTVRAVHREPERLRLVVHFEVEVVAYLEKTGTFGWIPQAWIGAAPSVAECEVELGLAAHLVAQVPEERFAEDVLDSLAEQLPAAMHSSRWRVLRARTVEGAVATVWSRPGVAGNESLHTVVQAVLAEEGWALTEEATGVWIGPRTVNDVALSVAIRVNEQSRTITTLARLPFEVSESRLAEAALVLHLVNRDLPFGSFELDVTHRTITFRATQVVGHGPVNASVTRTYLVAGAALAGQHADALMDLAL